jgi:hypothetical protein
MNSFDCLAANIALGAVSRCSRFTEKQVLRARSQAQGSASSFTIHPWEKGKKNVPFIS